MVALRDDEAVMSDPTLISTILLLT